MNKLTLEERARILHLLCEGVSIRAITRLTGASKNTVAKLLIDAGKACAAHHDATVRNVKAARILVVHLCQAKERGDGEGCARSSWRHVDLDGYRR